MDKKKLLRHLLKDKRGQFSVLLGLVVISVLLVVGVAVDGGRIYFSWTNLSRALDAACSAVSRKTSHLSDTQIQAAVTQVTQFNLQKGGAELDHLLVNTQVTRSPLLNSLLKLRVTGTITEFPSIFMRFLPNHENNTISAESICPTCYNSADSFTVPESNFYESGLACQQACNDGSYTTAGSTSCCKFVHGGWTTGYAGADCMCAPSAQMDINTDYCNPDSNPATAVNPANSAIGAGEVQWIDRPDENALQDACVLQCGQQGFQSGVIWCNEGCREQTGTVCCKCHCNDCPQGTCC